MRIAFICVLFHTPQKEVDRLTKEIKKLHLKDCIPIFIDNTHPPKGFAVGINKGIRKALQEQAEYLILANPDISLSNIKAPELLKGAKYFDIWGYAMMQDGKVYYGGQIDAQRMSGGLVTTKPYQRFVSIDFPCGPLFIVKRKVIETIGLFREDYHMYYEDVEFCERARRKGFTIGTDSGVVYEHYEVSKTNTRKSYYLARNRLLFLLEYGSWKQKLYELIRLPKTLYEYFS